MPRYELLPADYHMAVIELEGRYYPVRTERETDTGMLRLGTFPHFSWEVEAAYGTPYALGREPTHGVISFRDEQNAIDYCHRSWDNLRQRVRWKKLAAQTEVYPERNAWYREQIALLCREEPRLNVESDARASVFFRGGSLCMVWAATVDEAWEQLYTQVEATEAEQHPAASA